MRSLTRFMLYVVFATPFAAATVPAGCSSSDSASGSTGSGTTGTTTESTGTSTGGAGTGGATTTSGAGAGATTTSGVGGVAGGGGGIATCQGHVYQCGDGIDNDGDGLIDAADPDCLGPCDNTENSYYGGIPGQAGPGCAVDCYFDQDSGSGNDNCYWDHRCDSLETSPNYYPEGWLGNKCAYDPNFKVNSTLSCSQAYAMQSQQCLNYCGPLTPNGCDCFGCCELPAGGGKYVFLGSEDGSGNGSCTLDAVADPSKCEPCTPVAACLNTCEHCELCIGKTMLPSDCTGTGGSSGSSSGTGGSGTGQCPAGVQACGLPGQSPCPSGDYCITGCCQAVPK